MRRLAIVVVVLVLASCKSKEEKAAALVEQGKEKWTKDDFEGADADYRRALEHVPDYPPALFRRAQLVSIRKNPEKCREILSKCTHRDMYCDELDFACARDIRDRLATGSLEGANGVKLIDVATEGESLGCGLLFSLVLIETREKDGKPAPASFIDEVKRRMEVAEAVADPNDVLSGARIARAAGEGLGSMTTCAELSKAQREVETNIQNVLSTTNVPDQGSSATRANIVRTYALRAVLARVTKTPVKADPLEPPAADAGKPIEGGTSPTGPMPLPL